MKWRTPMVLLTGMCACMPAEAQHMQGEKVMLVRLRMIDTVTATPIVKHQVEYSVPKHEATDYAELRGASGFSRRRSVQSVTNHEGEVTLPLFFHFSYYDQKEAPFRQGFEYLRGSFRLRRNGRWISCAFSGDQSAPIRVEWIEIASGAADFPVEILLPRVTAEKAAANQTPNQTGERIPTVPGTPPQACGLNPPTALVIVNGVRPLVTIPRDGGRLEKVSSDGAVAAGAVLVGDQSPRQRHPG